MDKILDAVCAQVKYRGVHKAIRDELTVHIEETAQLYEDEGDDADNALSKAISSLGDAREIGRAFNSQYKMPFDSRYGLMLWSALYVAFIYFVLYPLISIINSESGTVRHEGLIVLALLALFAAVNYMILRRGHFRVNLMDIRDIAIGFAVGSVCSCAILFLLSLRGEYGYYLYCPKIRIMFFDAVNLYGGEVRSFFGELISCLSCFVLYLVSCPVKSRQHSLYFAANTKTPYPAAVFIDGDDVDTMVNSLDRKRNKADLTSSTSQGRGHS